MASASMAQAAPPERQGQPSSGWACRLRALRGGSENAPHGTRITLTLPYRAGLVG